MPHPFTDRFMSQTKCLYTVDIDSRQKTDKNNKFTNTEPYITMEPWAAVKKSLR